ncbi:carboxypeptidase regulatory-like domain-containing protein [Planctomicrobium piriforme]|nr:carboxypeptidase regulatory-like domain-containing protein [Planctomicrobium piriforme]
MSRTTLIAGIAAALLIVGCGRGPKLGDVEGVVTLDGKPVPYAVVIFVPQNVNPRVPSFGATDATGKYSLVISRDRRGAVLAEHEVQILTEKMSKRELQDLKETGAQVNTEFVPIPKKYRADGALKAEVKGGMNQIDFQLTSQ